MKINRIKKENNFVVLATHALRNESLSWSAKGLHSTIMQLPEYWELTVEGLASLSSNGRDATSSALKELIAAGYVVRARICNDKGQFKGYEYNIFEFPQSESENGLPENGKTVNGFSVNGLSENGKTATIKDEIIKDDLIKDDALNSIEFKEKEKSASEEKSEFSTDSLNTETPPKKEKSSAKKEKATEQPAEQLTEAEVALIESAKAGNRKMTEAQILRYEQPENVSIGVWSLFKEYAIARHKFKKPYTASVYAAQVEKLNKHYLDYQIEAWDAHLREAKERLWESPFFAGFKDHLSKLTKNTNHATHNQQQSTNRNNEPRTGEKIGYAMAELLEGINTEYLERKQREQSSRSGFH